MQVPLIESTAAAARVAFKQYQALPKRSKEDEQIMRAYRQLAKGTPLVRLSEAMANAGLDEAGLPKLAMGRADDKWCYLTMGWHSGGATMRSSEHDNRWQLRGQGAADRTWRLPPGTFGVGVGDGQSMRAMVPIIPAHLRPTAALSNYHILWEAEWQATPPKDPLLLKRVSQDLYAVLAVWDLTEVERAVLAARFR